MSSSAEPGRSSKLWVPELVLPGFVIGLVAGAIAGGLAAMGGLPPGPAAITAAALGVPLAAAGAGYNYLLAVGRFRLGGVAPAAMYWLLAFPVVRLLDETSADLALGQPIAYPDGLLRFIVWAMLMSLCWTVGFIFLHEHIAPLWWMRIRRHNPVAERYVLQYMQQAVATKQRKEARKQRNDRQPPAGKATRRGHTAQADHATGIG